MAYDESQADRVRQSLTARNDVGEKRIVGGGLGFMVAGHLCVGVSHRGLTVRVGPEAKASAVAEPQVGPLLVGSRETAAFVVVDWDALQQDEALAGWVARAVTFVETLA